MSPELRGLSIAVGLAIAAVTGCVSLLGDFSVSDGAGDDASSRQVHSNADATSDVAADDSMSSHANDNVDAAPAEVAANLGQPASTGQCRLPEMYSQACRPCVHGSCCSQEQACAQDPNCSQYAACILGCDRVYGCGNAADTNCQLDCSGSHSIGYQLFNSASGVDSCVSSSCGQKSCAMSCFSQ